MTTIKESMHNIALMCIVTRHRSNVVHNHLCSFVNTYRTRTKSILQMVQKIKDEQAAAERETQEREAERMRQEEEYLALRRAELEILQDERLAREAADAARTAAMVQAARERKARQQALRQDALQRKEMKRHEAQESKKAAVLARQGQAEEKKMELKAKRLAIEEKRQAAADMRRVQVQQRKEHVEAKRREAQENQGAAREGRLVATADTKMAAVDIPTTTTFESKAVLSSAKGSVGEDSLAEMGRAAAEKEEGRRNEELRLAEKMARDEAQRLERKKEQEERRRIVQGPPASSLARILAREYGLDISKIPPTGRGGRVTADDVRNALPPDETTPIDKTVDFFFADPADDMHEDGKCMEHLYGSFC